MIEISRDEARQLALIAQGLDTPPARTASEDDVLRIVRDLGCVQIDTISVVARSHYLVLWSRLGSYDQTWLDNLLHPDRSVFEYWAHAASIIPLELYPYFRRRMQEYAARFHLDSHEWVAENQQIMAHVLERIRAEGPIASRHFEREGNGPIEPWAWWGGKPANRALDILWSTGILMVQRRENFQRFYDLPERVAPELHGQELPSLADEQNALALAAVRAIGPTLPRWVNDYFRTRWGGRNQQAAPPEQVLSNLAAQGHLVGISIEDLGPAYVTPALAEEIDLLRSGKCSTVTTLLSPFDNLVWDRRRALELFDFDYRLECYVPAPKRRFGYYSMPILHRGRLIGRLDPKVERRRRHLMVRSLHLEPGVKIDRATGRAIADTLTRFAEFNGADTISFENGPKEIARLV